MTHVGLFEGIGGFSLAASWMGWKTIAWCEKNTFCQSVLKYYWPDAEGFGDIITSDFKKYANRVDVLTGGFPCQPVSQAGRQKGEQDERFLFHEMLRAIREIKPRVVVAENVRGLASPKFKKLFDNICASLESEGYKILPILLPASAVGCDHERYRFWFVAYSNSEHWEFPLQSEKYGKQIKRNGVKEVGSGNRFMFELAPYSRKSFGRWLHRPCTAKFYDGISTGLDTKTILRESTAAYGNAIVPQIAYSIFKTIHSMKQFNTTP